MIVDNKQHQQHSISIVRAIPDDRKEELLLMIHQAFEEYKNQGILFSCSNYSMVDLENKVLSGDFFVAMMEEKFVGITAVYIYEDTNMAYETLSAVHPDYQSMGIGKLLYLCRRQYLEERQITSLFSDTSIKAKKSVSWHLRTCGCNIYGFDSFPKTNYYSFVFREDINAKGRRYVHRYVLYPVHFLISYIKCMISKKEDGSLTLLGRWYKSIFRRSTIAKHS